MSDIIAWTILAIIFIVLPAAYIIIGKENLDNEDNCRDTNKE